MASLLEESGTSLEPPAPPDIDRRLKFYRLQAIGVPLLALVPILALFKLFDTSIATVEASGPGVSVSATYPIKLRHRTTEPLVIAVRNNGGATLEDVTLKVGRSYVDRFREVEFRPDADAIDADNYRFELGAIPPGELRKVQAVFEADTLGRQSGSARVDARTGSAEVHINTFVLP